MFNYEQKTTMNLLLLLLIFLLLLLIVSHDLECYKKFHFVVQDITSSS